MRFGLGIFLGFGVARGGGGAAPVAPVISDESYDDLTDILTAGSDQAGTLYALWSTSAVLTDAEIIADATTIEAVVAGIDYVDVGEHSADSGTYYLQFGIENAGGLFTQGMPIMVVVALPTFTETWDWLTAGNTWTQVDARYARSTSGIITTAVTDADATDGIAARIGYVGSAVDYESWDDIATALAARTTERVNVLMQIRFVSTSLFQRAGIGYVNGSSLFTGIRISRPSAGGNLIMVQHAANIGTTANATNVLTGLADLACYWARLDIDGTVIKARAWLDGASEPGTWVSRTEASAIAFANLHLTVYNGSPCLDVLGYSLGIGADAPGF